MPTQHGLHYPVKLQYHAGLDFDYLRRRGAAPPGHLQLEEGHRPQLVLLETLYESDVEELVLGGESHKYPGRARALAREPCEPPAGPRHRRARGLKDWLPVRRHESSSDLKNVRIGWARRHAEPDDDVELLSRAQYAEVFWYLVTYVAAAQVRADAMLSLTEIAEDAQKQARSKDSSWRAHGLLIERLIQGVMASEQPLQVAPVKVPPGSPI